MTDRLIQIKNALQNSPHYLVLISVNLICDNDFLAFIASSFRVIKED